MTLGRREVEPAEGKRPALLVPEILTSPLPEILATPT